MSKPWHYDMMTDTVYVAPWFFYMGAAALGVFVSLFALCLSGL